MTTLMKHVHEIMAIDKGTLAIFIFFCGIACWIIRDVLANPAFVVFIMPFLVVISMIFYHIFMKFELVITNNPQSWLTWAITSTTLGLCVGLSIVAGLMYLLDRDNPQHNVGA